MDFSECDPVVRRMDLVVGGVVDPSALVGRTSEERLSHEAIVTANGAVLVGDRRMGKTSLLRKLARLWQQAGHTVVFVSAQTTDPRVLADRLHERLASMSWFQRERKRWALNIKVGAKGITLERTGGRGEVPGPVDLLAWAAEQVAPGRLIVMVDELTVLLAAMSAGENEADEFLNHLRRSRQEQSNLTVVLAGSVGLHHVVPPGRGLVNDLHRIVIGPLDPCDGLELAMGLLAGIELDAERSFAEDITSAAGAVPYYIHWLVQQIQLDGDTLAAPADRLRNAMNDPLDPLDFRHYRQRLGDYYGDRAQLAERILDHVAVGDTISVDEITRALGADDIDPRPNRRDVIALIDLLEADNYLERDPDGHSRFASTVLAMAWRIMQRLES